MALKRPLLVAFTALALVSALVLARELRTWRAIEHFNTALAEERYADAAPYLGDHGAFAEAYAEHRRGDYQAARVIYARLEHSENLQLGLAATYNIGNTYLEQALGMDVDAEADRALPLIELAKISYRDVLQADSGHWDAKYNLQRALELSPDVPDRALMELDGLRGTIRTLNTADPEGALP